MLPPAGRGRRRAPAAMLIREARPGLRDRFADRIAEREADGGFAAGAGEIVAGAGEIRARQDPSRALWGSCASARSSSLRWSPALLAPAFPGRRIPGRISRPGSPAPAPRPEPTPARAPVSQGSRRVPPRRPTAPPAAPSRPAPPPRTTTRCNALWAGTNGLSWKVVSIRRTSVPPL
jgi:hypothetical protein